MSYRKECPTCGRPAIERGPLTDRQAAVYRYVEEFITARGFAPSNHEIAQHFGYSSLATVHEHLEGLERKGWITKIYNEPRGIALVRDAIATSEALS